MTARTQLDPEEARQLLRNYGLKLYGVRPLPLGTINSNYRVETDAGPLFLRINEGKTEHDVRFETDLIWHLGSRGLPTPQVFRTLRGEPFTLLPDRSAGPAKPVMLMAWVPGHELSEDQIGEEEAQLAGAVLARLHLCGAGFRRARTGIYTLSHVQDRVQRLHDDPRVPDGTVEYLRREVLRLKDSRRNDLPTGLGHNDLFPDNLLFTKACRRRHQVGWVLDLEQAATLPYAYDVAVALLSFCAPVAGTDAQDEERIGPVLRSRGRALLSGYQEVRPLSEAERLGLYQETRFAALRFTVTRLTDVHLRRQKDISPPRSVSEQGTPVHSKDYRDFLRRLEQLESIGPEDFAEGLC